MRKTILVTGASGALGQRICEDLLHSNAHHLVAASRDVSKLEPLRLAGAEVRHIDFDDMSTLESGFQGVDRAVVISTDALDVPGRRAQQHRRAIQAVVRAKVQHVLYTSMPNPDLSDSIPFAVDHAEMEASLRKNLLSYSIFRNSWYFENLLAFLPQIVAAGFWPTSAGSGKISYVARDDIAEAAAKIISRVTDTGTTTYEIAGAQALTIDEMAEAVSAATGRSLQVRHDTRNAVGQQLLAIGIPRAIVQMVLMTEANQSEGHFDVGAGALAMVLGREPEDLQTFIQRNHAQLTSFPAV